jgi:dTDP-4-dehydrorhamnose reductase
MKRLALVFGSRGQLGTAMTEQFSARHTVVPMSRADVDITKAAEVRSAILSVDPDLIINCTAYTNVDRAEDEPLAALAVNGWAVEAMARTARDIDATLVHYSTDFVFDGCTAEPYDEEATPNPRSTYGASKLLGEWFAAETPRHYILRVESLFGGLQARSTIDRMAALLSADKPVRAFSDRTVSPSFVDDVVGATLALVDRDAPPGLYHCVNSGWTTWAGVAHELARVLGRPGAAIEEVTVADANLAVSRPQFAALSNAKLQAAGAAMPSWQDSLARYFRH